MHQIKLKPGREKSILHGHPWIFSGSVARASTGIAADDPGQTVKILDSEDQFLAWGAISPQSKIRVRVWSLNPDEQISATFIGKRLSSAVYLRDQLGIPNSTNAFRLVHGESDGLPGLVVDKYDQNVVVQFLTCGAEFWRDTIIAQLVEITGCRLVYERSDAEVRRLEGLAPRKGLLWGENLDKPVEIHEEGLRYWVDINKGQKTGFFLDQRDRFPA